MTNVLNIQGDEQVSRLMSWILTEDGFDVINVRDPEAASAHVRPDVIIVNTNMTVLEKCACIDALRALVPGVGIIDLGVGAELPQYDTGANAYLNKPFNAADLIERVRSLGDLTEPA